MKRALLFFIILRISISITYGQPIGFEESQCGIINNSSYDYENIDCGEHTFGYALFHNGKIIAEDCESPVMSIDL